MFYTYEGSIIRESEGGYTVAVPSFECMVAGGTSVKEACENAAGCLQLLIADMLDNDEPLPEATFGEAPQLVLCVEVGDGFIRESLCMTLAEAAEELGVLISFWIQGSSSRHIRLASAWSLFQASTNASEAHRALTTCAGRCRITAKTGTFCLLMRCSPGGSVLPLPQSQAQADLGDASKQQEPGRALRSRLRAGCKRLIAK